MITRLFVYGTLAPGRPNEYVLSDLEGTWQSASVSGHLREKGWGAALGYPGIDLTEDGESVEGFVFDSPDLAQHWERLDTFEGKAYQRVLTSVMLDDSTRVEAFVYVLRKSD